MDSLMLIFIWATMSSHCWCSYTLGGKGLSQRLTGSTSCQNVRIEHLFKNIY